MASIPFVLVVPLAVMLVVPLVVMLVVPLLVMMRITAVRSSRYQCTSELHWP